MHQAGPSTEVIRQHADGIGVTLYEPDGNLRPLEAIEAGEISADATVVCMITGSGFKDPGSVEKMTVDNSCPVIDASEVEAAMGQGN